MNGKGRGEMADERWRRFEEQALYFEGPGLWLDFSTLRAEEGEWSALAQPLEAGLDALSELENGAVANPDEGRQVGHYWLRAPELAPSAEQRRAIETALDAVESFGRDVRRGTIGPAPGVRFRHLLLVGIGGSALGPQLVSAALPRGEGALHPVFLDNTDPEGFDTQLGALGPELSRTLAVITSKSGGTPETRNGLEETLAAFRAADVDPFPRLVAVTGDGSALESRARAEGWLEVFPMWDWVGGRTSQTSTVGLLPMSLLGQDLRGLLAGAAEMDRLGRLRPALDNPAARLAAAWHIAGEGKGRRDMVVIPYRDRLALLARYLQQLVMESLGKRHDLGGREVRQGLTVYGNKGSTDQHAYVQQLRDGLDNYFLTLVGTLSDPPSPRVEVEPGVTSGDYLLGFLLGTRRALEEDRRRVVSLMLERLDARSLGALIALYERAVGIYAQLIGVNAYHQPGVEAGKRAARGVLDLQRALTAAMRSEPRREADAAEWAARAGSAKSAVEAQWVLMHLALSGRGVRRRREKGKELFSTAASD